MDLKKIVEKFKNLDSENKSGMFDGLKYATFTNTQDIDGEEKDENIQENIKDSSDVYSEFFTSDLVRDILNGRNPITNRSASNDESNESNQQRAVVQNNNVGGFSLEGFGKYTDLKDNRVIKSNKDFNKLLDEVEKKDKRVAHYRPFLQLMASKESGFNKNATAVTNKHHGFFQINNGSIRELSPGNLSIEEFKNNPEAQVITAMNLADEFKRGWSKKDIQKGRDLGYGEFSMLSGSWLGGNGNLMKFLYKGINADDSHHYTADGSKDPSKGANMRDRMNLFKKI